jgi:uncharacterized damage-inducible protein DinB
MKPISADTSRILKALTNAPGRIRKATRGLKSAQLHAQSETEPWSLNDLLAHLRACSYVWGKSISAMLAQDNPTQRYASPRSWMRKPGFANQEFDLALKQFTSERQKLVKVLAELDAAGWARPGTFTGTSSRGRNQTVQSYADRIINHEHAHLDQIETLARQLARGN